MWKKTGLAVLVLLLILVVWQRELISYGLMQGRGQFKVLWNARPLEEVLQDPAVPDSLKQRLQYIGAIREWGVAELGLKETKNYTTLYDQQGQEILWVITACHPYKLENMEWRFPVVGTVSYKGFFDHERALAEKAELDAAGWDTHIRSVSAWSTLGWFRDPILSNMLFRPEGDVANTVLHELTHATIFVKDSLTFNENLASFIGHQGALLFLKDRWGAAGKPLQQYQERHQDRQLFTEHVLRGVRRLDSLYTSFAPTLSNQIKEEKKQALIQEIIDQTAKLPLHQPREWQRFFAEQQPNNAYFMSYERYSGGLEELERELDQRFGGDLRRFLTHYKQRFGR